MDNAIRFLVVMLIILMALAGFLSYSVYAATRQAGFISLEIDPAGFQPSFYIPIPAVMVNAFADAVSVNGVACDDCELREWRPAVHAALQEFDRYPDIVLLDVTDREHHVRVRKAGRQLVVEVESDEADVRIVIPHRTVKKVANAITAATNINMNADYDDDCDEDDRDVGSLDV